MEKGKMIKLISEEIGEIYKIVSKINVKGKHNIFWSDSPHVKKIEFKVYLNGKKYYQTPDFVEEVRYDIESKWYSFEKSMKALRDLKDSFNKINKNGKLNLENYCFEEEIVKNYNLKRSN